MLGQLSLKMFLTSTDQEVLGDYFKHQRLVCRHVESGEMNLTCHPHQVDYDLENCATSAQLP